MNAACAPQRQPIAEEYLRQTLTNRDELPPPQRRVQRLAG